MQTPQEPGHRETQGLESRSSYSPTRGLQGLGVSVQAGSTNALGSEVVERSPRALRLFDFPRIHSQGTTKPS